MSQTAESTSHMKLPYLYPYQVSKSVIYNEALRWLDAIIHLAVETRHSNNIPTNPANQQRFIVGPDPDETGA